MNKEELIKVIDLQEEIGSPYIVIHKPKAKNKIVEFDSDTAAFDIVDSELMFDFWDIEGFTVKLDRIKEITKSVVDGLTIVYLKLKYGNTIMLHFVKM
jgi:hypothetical protein